MNGLGTTWRIMTSVASENGPNPGNNRRFMNGLGTTWRVMTSVASVNGNSPAAVSTIARAIERSPNELLEESFAFAIMGRNVELVGDLIRQIQKAEIDISSLHPGHLAISYLDGAKSCCNILDLICLNFRRKEI